MKHFNINKLTSLGENTFIRLKGWDLGKMWFFDLLFLRTVVARTQINKKAF